MSEEEQYFIHSDVFLTTDDKTNHGNFCKNSLQFLVLSNEINEETTIDDDGDFDLYRPERFNLTLGIYFIFLKQG